MFLLLSFLFSSRAGTCALPILLSRFSEASIENPVFDVTTTASTGACTGRSLWDILWSCLATTFACTWVSVHPNIPFLRESKTATRRWRVYLTLVSLFAPEIMILWASKQLQGALVIMRTVNCSYREYDENEGGVPETETRTDSQDADRVGKAAKELKQKEKDNSPLWTLTHAQYLQMGGYRLQCLTSEEKLIPSRYGRREKAMFAGGERDVWELPLSFETMKAAFNKGYIDIPFIPKDVILEKGGRDGLSKAIAMLQLTWFILQTAARVRQNLAVTELELTTAALACLNIAIYISWWSKPIDIQCPTIITTKGLQDQDRQWMRNVPLPSSLHETTQLADEAHDRSLPPVAKVHYFVDQIGHKEKFDPATYYWYEFRAALHDSLKFVVESPAKLVNGLLGIASKLGVLIRSIWTGSLSSTDDPPSKASETTPHVAFRKVLLLIFLIVWNAITGLSLIVYYAILAILGRRSHPSRFAEKDITGMDETTIQLLFNWYTFNFALEMVFFCEKTASVLFLFLSALSGAIFGMIHCLAWNFEFPSHVEQIMWRICSSVITGLCVYIMVIAFGYLIIWQIIVAKMTSFEIPTERTRSEDQSMRTPSESSRSPGDNSFMKTTEVACSVFTICLGLTRLSLLTLSIIELRSLPASAFDTVQWSGFIPHI